jgi:hypothetical protein
MSRRIHVYHTDRRTPRSGRFYDDAEIPLAVVQRTIGMVNLNPDLEIVVCA